MFKIMRLSNDLRLSNDFYPIVGDKFNLNLRQLKQEHKFVRNMLKYFLKSQLPRSDQKNPNHFNFSSFFGDFIYYKAE